VRPKKFPQYLSSLNADGSINADSPEWRSALRNADVVIDLSAAPSKSSPPASDVLYLDDMGADDALPVVPDLAMGGQVTLIHGKPGSGKSTITRQAILSVITGRPFLGKPVTRGAVLLYPLDEGQRHARKTLIDRMGLPVDRPDAPALYIVDLPAPTPGYGFGEGKAATRLHNNLLRHPDVRLVVIDTLQSFFQIEDVNDNSEAALVMQSLRGVAKHHSEVAFVVVHHAGKNGAYLGATTLMGGVDIAYQMEKDEAVEGANYLVNEKWRTIDKQPRIALAWDQETHLYRVVEGAADTWKRKQTERTDEKRDRILSALAGAPNGLPKTKLFAVVKGNWTANESTLTRLVEAGTIAQTGSGSASVYRLTAAQ